MRFRIFGRVVFVHSAFLVITVLAVFLIVALIGYAISNKEEGILIMNTPTPVVHETEARPTEVKLISVHIIGCVKDKKVVRIPYGSTVENAVTAAGGFTDDADPDAVNLAFRLSDGMQIKIPSINDQDKEWLINEGDTDNPKGDGLVSINDGTLEELTTLPGIGESIAKSIINYRIEHDGFKTLEEIKQVPGIKDAKYNDIKDLIKL